MRNFLPREATPAWAIFGAGLLATVFFSLQVKRGIDEDALRQFGFTCDQVTLKIQERLGAYALILRGGAALFAASKEVSRDDWRNYVETLRAAGSVPGVQGIGFAKVIEPHELATHTARIRAEGFPDYAVHPAGKRADYTSIIYLEPFRDRNLRAFGFDMFSEPVRRAAMEQARDTGEAALSGKVELVQETGTEVQAGTLMYVPVYRNGAAASTVEQKRAALIGWAYSPYRMDDLLGGILANWTSQEGKVVDLHIYDGPQEVPASLLFGNITDHDVGLNSWLHLHRKIDFNGQQWLLEFDRTASGIGYSPAWFVLIGGLALSGLLFALMLSVIKMQKDITERKRAAQALHESEGQFRGLVEQSIAGIYIIQDGKYVYVNPRFAEICGYDSMDEVVGRDALSLVTPEDRDEVAEKDRQLLSGEIRTIPYSFAVLRKDGITVDIGANAAFATHRGKPAIIGLMQDITEKKRDEDEIKRYVAQLENAFMSAVKMAMNLGEMRDPYTAGHQRRVAEIAVALGAELGFDARRQEGLRVAGYLHDIGKISIPAEILSKPGKLSSIQLQLIQEHPQLGYDVLKDLEFPWPVAQVALQHHERMDGNGYPLGLKGEAILLEARIIVVADVIEAMSSHRPYRPGLGMEATLAEIERGRGTAYDPDVADACLKLFREKGYTIPA